MVNYPIIGEADDQDNPQFTSPITHWSVLVTIRQELVQTTCLQIERTRACEIQYPETGDEQRKKQHKSGRHKNQPPGFGKKAGEYGFPAIAAEESAQYSNGIRNNTQ